MLMWPGTDFLSRLQIWPEQIFSQAQRELSDFFFYILEDNIMLDTK